MTGVILTTLIKEDLRRQEGELRISVEYVQSRFSLSSMTRVRDEQLIGPKTQFI